MASLALAGTVLVLAFDIAHPAHAYLDPGTGSIMLQLLLGGVAGSLVIFKLYWQKFKDLFSRGEAGDLIQTEIKKPSE